MTNSDGPAPATKVAASGPVAQELAEWLKAIRVGWTQSLGKEHEEWTDERKHRFRLMYALSGSVAWLGGTAVLVLGDPRFVNFLYSDLMTALAMPVAMLFAFWTGWLVAFADRKAGPIRLFLDGLLLPTATIAIVALSAQRIQSARLESAVSSESTPVTLRPLESNGTESTRNGSESAVSESSDESERANETPN